MNFQLLQDLLCENQTQDFTLKSYELLKVTGKNMRLDFKIKDNGFFKTVPGVMKITSEPNVSYNIYSYTKRVSYIEL